MTVPCKNGHTTGRRKNGRCIGCHRASQRRYALANKANCLAATRAWAEKNVERVKDIKRRWEKENPDLRREFKRKWLKTNPEKQRAADKRWKMENREKLVMYFKQYDAKNRGKKNAHCAARRARIAKATPPWADMKAIRLFYERCPAGRHVDHIIPLHGKYVCGFHVEANLQYLPALDNQKKSNSFVLETDK